MSVISKIQQDSNYAKSIRDFMRNPIRRTFTVLGATLIVLLIFILGAIRPTLIKITEVRAEIEKRKETNERLQRKINVLQDLQEVVLEREDDFEILDLFFPPDADYSLLMAALEKITESYGYEMTSLHVGVNEKGSGGAYQGMEEVDLRLYVTGPLSDLPQLLEHLENLPVVANMDGVSFSPTGSDEGNTTVPFSISMTLWKQETMDSSTDTEES